MSGSIQGSSSNDIDQFLGEFKTKSLREKASFVNEKREVIHDLANKIISDFQDPLCQKYEKSQLKLFCSVFKSSNEIYAEYQPIVQMCSERLKQESPTKSDVSSPSIHDATMMRTTAELEALLKEPSTDINSRDSEGRSPLHLAVKDRNFSSLELLISGDADINSQDNEGSTPLHQSLKMGKKGVMNAFNKLIDSEADINLQDNSGRSPLHLAIQQKNITAIKTLVQHEAVNINIPDNEGKTPIHYIMESNLKSSEKSKIARLLLARQGNVDIKDNSGNSAVMLAAKSKSHSDIFPLLIQSSSELNTVDSQGKNLLHALLESRHRSGSIKSLTQTLKNQAEVAREVLNGEDHAGTCPMDLVIKRGGGNLNLLILNTLKETRSQSTGEPLLDINKTGEGGQTFLHKSIRKKSPELIKIFMSEASLLNTADDSLNTPLHQLALSDISSRDALFEEIVNSGANPDLINEEGKTALSLLSEVQEREVQAAHDKKMKAIRPRQLQGFGETPVHKASRLGSTRKLEALLEENPSMVNEVGSLGRAPLHVAVKNRRNDVFELLVAKEANLNAQDADGNTPLHQALKMSKKGNAHAMEGLIRSGADINLKNNEGKSPLHLAVIQQNTNAISQLLNQSTLNPNQQDQSGSTVLHDLALLDTQRKPSLLKLLMKGDMSVDPNIPNNNGDTAVMFAIKNQRTGKKSRISGQGNFIKLVAPKMTNFEQRDSEGNNLLHLAFKEKVPTPWLRAVLTELKKYPETANEVLSATNNEGETPMDLFSKLRLGDRRRFYTSELRQAGLGLLPD